jgi:hypothetical protein
MPAKRGGLFFSRGTGFARYQYLTAVVQIAVYLVGTVQTVNFTRGFADAKCGHFGVVVCAAGALAAF